MAGPLQSFNVKGQPIVTDASFQVMPGQPVDATTYVINSSRDPVTLVSASVVPVSGFPTATLSHLAVDTTLHLIGAGRNWPPPVPVRPFAGAKLSHGESRITFAITGRRTGVSYATAGLKITYTYHGQVYSVTAWSAVLACVTTPQNANNPAVCSPSAGNRLMNTVTSMAG
ncbi:MAG: hypothetical protein ACLQFR_16575 [Streptosporangiaceae bacterium]